VHINAEALAGAYADITTSTTDPATEHDNPAGEPARGETTPGGEPGHTDTGHADTPTGDAQRDTTAETTADAPGEGSTAGDNTAGHDAPATDPEQAGTEPADTVGAHPSHEEGAAGPRQPRPRMPRPGVRCDVEPGIGLSPHTVRRLACDAWLRALVVDDAGNPLDLGRRQRTATGRLREAIYARDRGTCQYPTCERTRWLHIHHLDHWADDGESEPDNLILICGYHHRAVHEGGYTLYRDIDGTVTVHLPDGSVVHPAPPLHPGRAPLARFTHATGHTHPGAITPNWAGDALHLAGSLHAILSRLPKQPAGDPTPHTYVPGPLPGKVR
jgi:hypothetical protein